MLKQFDYKSTISMMEQQKLTQVTRDESLEHNCVVKISEKYNIPGN